MFFSVSRLFGESWVWVIPVRASAKEPSPAAAFPPGLNVNSMHSLLVFLGHVAGVVPEASSS